MFNNPGSFAQQIIRRSQLQFKIFALAHIQKHLMLFEELVVLIIT
jgi:hypothetical protein